MKAQRSSVIALPIHALGTKWGLVVNTLPQPLYPKKDLVLFVHESGWASGWIWMGTEYSQHHQLLIPRPSSP